MIDAEKAALEHLARHKELGLAYGDSAHIGIFLAGVKLGRQEDMKKRNPNDATMRNINALKKRVARLERLWQNLAKAKKKRSR